MTSKDRISFLQAILEKYPNVPIKHRHNWNTAMDRDHDHDDDDHDDDEDHDHGHHSHIAQIGVLSLVY